MDSFLDGSDKVHNDHDIFNNSTHTQTGSDYGVSQPSIGKVVPSVSKVAGLLSNMVALEYSNKRDKRELLTELVTQDKPRSFKNYRQFMRAWRANIDSFLLEQHPCGGCQVVLKLRAFHRRVRHR